MTQPTEARTEDWVQKIEVKDDQTVRVTVKTLEGEQAVYQVYRQPAFSEASCFTGHQGKTPQITF